MSSKYTSGSSIYLSSSIINKITPTQIEIKLYNKDVFPLDDGSYPGIKIQRGSSSSNLTELEVDNIPSYSDDSSYRYLTYTFANNFTLPEGTHYFKVTNGEETSSTKSITLIISFSLRLPVVFAYLVN